MQKVLVSIICLFVIGVGYCQDIPWDKAYDVERILEFKEQWQSEYTIAKGVLKLRSKVDNADHLNSKYVLIKDGKMIGVETHEHIDNYLDKDVLILGTFFWLKEYDMKDKPFCYITAMMFKQG